MINILLTIYIYIWKTYRRLRNADSSGLYVHENENQIKDQPWLFAAVKKWKRNRTSAEMRQIDGTKENLTKINGTAGNNHDGEKEEWK
jgi:hypothetical protein